MIPLIWGHQGHQIHIETKVGGWVPGAGQEGWELVFNGDRVSIWEDGKF